MMERTHRSHVHLTFALTVLMLLTTCCGSPPKGEDSRAHHRGGGHYPARTPSLPPDGSVVVAALTRLSADFGSPCGYGPVIGGSR